MIDPKKTPPRDTFEAKISSPSMRKKSHPWAWIISIVLALLFAWAFFGRDHLKVDPAPVPTPAATVAPAG